VFPDYNTTIEHILKVGPSRRALRAACVVPKPTTSDLQWIWKELAHCWENVRVPGSFRSIRQVLKRLPDHSGTPLRLAWAPTAQWAQARTIFAPIKGVYFRIEDGSFFYSTSAGIEGRMSCRSSDFRMFVKRVISQRPNSVKRFEELL
jgi:hypothetical protein